ncbi:MAG: hypothetical protein E6R03_05130 [Hyphomicrobiaceae bacterium]|nr:MAG: hypothetical protein E6R03_05130 [Hyphomicrobiaceae bacterium]
MQDLSDDKPPIVILSPDYDSSNPDHVRRWELAGRPSLTDLDASGQHWRLTIPGDLQSDGSYLPRTLPMPAPVTDVERMTALFTEVRRGAPLMLDALKGQVWVALVAGGMQPDEATAAGVALVLRFGAELAAYNSAGGHPVAAAALYAAISSPESQAALTWLTPEILALFQAALVPA